MSLAFFCFSFYQSWAISNCVLASVVTGVAVFLMLRSTTDVSSKELYRAELRLFSSVRCGVQARWCTFEAAGLTWTLRWVEGGRCLDDVQPHRPTVVIVPGHSGQSGQWAGVIEALHAGGARVCILDMPGWGLVPAPPQLSHATDPDAILNLQTQCILGWLQAQNMRNVVLAGHSVGGLLCSHVAAAAPPSVGRLLLMDACGVFPFLSHRWGWSVAMALLTPTSIMLRTGRLAHAIVRNGYNLGTREDVRLTDYYAQLYGASQYSGRADTAWGRLIAFAPFSCARRGWWKRPGLGVLMRMADNEKAPPVDILWAGDDELFPVQFAHSLQALLGKDTDLYVLQGCLHNPCHNNSLGTALAILDVVRKHSGGQNTQTATGSGLQLNTSAEKERLLLDAARSGAVRSLVATNGVEALSSPVAAVLSQKLAKGDTVGPAKPRSTAYLKQRLADMGHLSADQSAEVRNDTSEGVPVGWCQGCEQAVMLHKAYWSCGCGAWSFNYGPGAGNDTLHKLQAFLHALHCDQRGEAFDASGRHAHLTSHHPVARGAAAAAVDPFTHLAAAVDALAKEYPVPASLCGYPSSPPDSACSSPGEGGKRPPKQSESSNRRRPRAPSSPGPTGWQINIAH